MDRRKTLGGLSPNPFASRPSLLGTRVGQGKRAAQSSIGANPVKGNTRRSTVQTKTSGKREDPRPFKDRNFLRACARRVITFLAENGYDQQISEDKLLDRNGANKHDIELIFRFLARCVDPAGCWSGKLEDDLPLLLKRLGYPFTMAKSYLTSFSPMGWPQVLGALTWLVEVTSFDPDRSRGEGENCEQDQDGEQQFFEYVSRSYAYFLRENDDKVQEEEKFLKAQFQQQKEQLQREVDNIKEDSAVLQRQIQERQARPSRLIAANEERSNAERQLKEREEGIQQLQEWVQTLTKKISTLESDTAAINQTIKLTKTEVGELEQRIECQTVSKEDMERMTSEKRMKQNILEAVSNERQDADGVVIKAKEKLEEAWHALEGAVRRYNDHAKDLKLLPATSKRANGFQFELQIKRAGASTAEIVGMDPKTMIRPSLKRVADAYEAQRRGLKQEHTQLSVKLDKLQMDFSATRDDNQDLEHEVARVDLQVESLKELADSELASISAEAQDLEAQVDRMRNASEHSLKQSEEAFRELQQQYNNLVAATKEEALVMHDSLQTAMRLLVEHHEHVNDTVRSLHHHIGSRRDDVYSAASRHLSSTTAAPSHA